MFTAISCIDYTYYLKEMFKSDKLKNHFFYNNISFYKHIRNYKS